VGTVLASTRVEFPVGQNRERLLRGKKTRESSKVGGRDQPKQPREGQQAKRFLRKWPRKKGGTEDVGKKEEGGGRILPTQGRGNITALNSPWHGVGKGKESSTVNEKREKG